MSEEENTLSLQEVGSKKKLNSRTILMICEKIGRLNEKS